MQTVLKQLTFNEKQVFLSRSDCEGLSVVAIERGEVGSAELFGFQRRNSCIVAMTG